VKVLIKKPPSLITIEKSRLKICDIFILSKNLGGLKKAISDKYQAKFFSSVE